tara:strand:+ start:1410 stop:1598 length:189 start_codon:yes stop_codon:yes gene_type:complete
LEIKRVKSKEHGVNQGGKENRALEISGHEAENQGVGVGKTGVYIPPFISYYPNDPDNTTARW